MTANPRTPVTAQSLLAALERCGPAADGAELMLETDPPAELEPVLRVLHTGVRALLAGRPWWGVTSAKPRVVALNPAAPIPVDVALLCVEGDPCWDRVPPAAPIDLPQAFAAR